MAAVGLAMLVALPLQAYVVGPLFHDRKTIPYLMGLALRPLLDVRVKFNGAAMEQGHHPLIYIGNHLSYLDPVILSRYVTAAYVCQDGAKDMPLAGSFCKALGTIFVHRTPAFLVQMQGDMARTLNEGRDVAIYPEGHCSDGKDVLPFFNGALSVLFNNKSGVELEVKPLVQPFAERLLRVDGQDVETHPELREIFAWTSSDLTMWGHLWRLMHVRSVDIEVTALPALDPANYKDRRSFTEAAYNVVRDAVVQPQASSPAPL